MSNENFNKLYELGKIWIQNNSEIKQKIELELK